MVKWILLSYRFSVPRELFDRCESIIVATDAGREGELIFRYVYNYLGCTKPFARLWISSLTDKAIREGLRNLREGSLYDNLTSPPKPAAKRTGSWASTALRHSALPPDRACSPWDGYRHPHWR